MRGNFTEPDNLGTLFGAIADVFDRREEMLLERIAALEGKIEQLEEKIAMLEESVPCFEDTDKAQEDESVVESGEEVEEPEEETATMEEELPEIEVELEFDFDDDQMGVQEQPFEDIEEIEVVDEVEDVVIDNQLEETLEDKEEDCREEDMETVLVLDKVRPDWYDWEVDIPGHYIDDIREGIGLNDKILFMNELFGGSAEVFNEAIDHLNQMHNLVETVEYLRERFPHWDDESDEVYRFYMTVRRRFNKQK